MKPNKVKQLQLVDTIDTFRTRPSCLVCVGDVNRISDKKRQFCFVSTQFPISNFSVIISIFETEQLQIGNWVETDKTVLSCRQFCNTVDTDKTVLSAV